MIDRILKPIIGSVVIASIYFAFSLTAVIHADGF